MDEVEKLFKWFFVPMESVGSPRRFLYTALTSVFFLNDYCGETKLEFGIVGCGKGFPKCSLIPFVNVNHYFHHLSHRIIFFRVEVAEIPFHCLAAESHHNHQEVRYTLKLKELPSFVRVADMKGTPAEVHHLI